VTRVTGKRFRLTVPRSTGDHYKLLGLLEILALVAILLMFPFRAGGANVPVDSGLTLQTSCSSQQLEATPATFTSVLSATHAAALSNSSSNYVAAVASLGPGVTVNYTGVTDLSNLILATCSATFTNFDVAYQLTNATNQSGQLSIWVNPSTGAITNTTIQWMLGEASHGSTGQWWGWQASPCASCAIHGTYAQWQNFGVGSASSHCGATILTPGACAISF
jgi:hypothetical protein